MKPGFYLIEFLVYLCVTTIFSLVIFRGTAHSLCALTSSARHAQSIIDSAIAVDLITRDLLSAPGNRSDWYKTEQTEIIWRNGDIARGWYWRYNKLIRVNGTYDGSWHKATHNVVLTTDKPLLFFVEKMKNRVTAVCLFQTKNKKTVRSIVLRNGNLL